MTRYDRFRVWFARIYENNKHLLILLYFFVYLAWFHYVETSVTTHFHVVHVALDDHIPFCEYFVIPYLLWFFYVGWGIVYMALHNKADYYKLCAFLFTGMTIFLIVSTLYPNGHYLRPQYFAHHNVFTSLCELLYTSDTPTNLFPSIHVYNSIGIHLAVMQNRQLRNNKTVQLISFLLMASIILATMFIKQHSVFDVCTAFALAFLMYRVVYKRHWEKSSAPQKSRGGLLLR
ncbi:MAG: phosphatase PAP2 family protein [Blautia sp.]|nr:phosphatase PAP2 family protein [Blautia sp.]